MNPEIMKLYHGIKDYIQSGIHGWQLKGNAPKDVQEKFKILMELEDDLVFVEDINDFISGK